MISLRCTTKTDTLRWEFRWFRKSIFWILNFKMKNRSHTDFWPIILSLYSLLLRLKPHTSTPNLIHSTLRTILQVGQLLLNGEPNPGFRNLNVRFPRSSLKYFFFISVIKLKEPLEFRRSVQPACLGTDHKFFYDGVLKIAGWGWDLGL